MNVELDKTESYEEEQDQVQTKRVIKSAGCQAAQNTQIIRITPISVVLLECSTNYVLPFYHSIEVFLKYLWATHYFMHF